MRCLDRTVVHLGGGRDQYEAVVQYDYRVKWKKLGKDLAPDHFAHHESCTKSLRIETGPLQ
jgi:hypothetical protein